MKTTRTGTGNYSVNRSNVWGARASRVPFSASCRKTPLCSTQKRFGAGLRRDEQSAGRPLRRPGRSRSPFSTESLRIVFLATLVCVVQSFAAPGDVDLSFDAGSGIRGGLAPWWCSRMEKFSLAEVSTRCRDSRMALPGSTPTAATTLESLNSRTRCRQIKFHAASFSAT